LSPTKDLNRKKNYTFHEFTYSFCPDCNLKVPAKIIFRDKRVLLQKRCPKHGMLEHLLEEDQDFYLKSSQFDKPGTLSKTQNKVKLGCPYDCGLCEDHEQHTCIGLIEVTNSCDLGCPVCYASSGKGKFLELTTIEKMLDFYQDSEFGKAEILQISGGEPTMHPDILKIIALAKAKKFKYIMLNTNGLKIAADEAFVAELSKFKGGFEIYLQYDGQAAKTYQALRGRDIAKEKQKAIALLTKYQIPITLVTTVAAGVNENELGSILNFGLKTKFIRGVNFQPIAYFGRLPGKQEEAKRITLTGILKRIESQTSGMIKKNDFIPLPCHVERVAFTYLYREGDQFIPVTRNMAAQKYVPMIENTFTFYPEDVIKNLAKGIIICNDGNCFQFFKDFRKIIPANYRLKSKSSKYEHINNNTFRISVSSFIDQYNFDMKSVKKECVHIITPDLKKIPFSTFNMFYRSKYLKEFYAS